MQIFFDLIIAKKQRKRCKELHNPIPLLLFFYPILAAIGGLILILVRKNSKHIEVVVSPKRKSIARSRLGQGRDYVWQNMGMLPWTGGGNSCQYDKYKYLCRILPNKKEFLIATC
jgi:hypothetical protein